MVGVGWAVYKHYHPYKVYETDYYSYFGMGDCHLYKSVVPNIKAKHIGSDIGQPESTGFTDITENFEGYSFYFSKNNDAPKEKALCLSVTVTDPNYRLGKYEVGMGSTKEFVEKVYKGVRKSPDKYGDDELRYIEKFIHIHFKFKDNRVSEIFLLTSVS